MATGDIKCWGGGAHGPLGLGNTGHCLTKNYERFCDESPTCCIGDVPGEMPPPSLVLD